MLRFPPNVVGRRGRGLFGAGGLQAGIAASDRRFQLSILDEVRQQQQRQLEGLSDVLAQSDANQQKMVELQNDVTNALAEAVRIQTDAVNAIENAQNSDRDESNTRLASIEQLMTVLRDQTGVAIDELDRRLSSILSPNGNLVIREAAGGLVCFNSDQNKWLRIRPLEALTVEVTLMNPENI